MAGNAKAQWLEPECEPLREFESRFLEDFYGWTTVPIGDIDGDGVIDIAVAAVFDDSGAPSAGKVYALSGADGSELWTRVETQTSSVLGYVMETVGDWNGDGFTDVIVGAPFNQSIGGRVWIYSGVDGATLELLDPSNPIDCFGAAIATGGDVDGDGVDDILIGSPCFDSNGMENAGRLYIYSGADASIMATIDGPFTDADLGSGVAFLGDISMPPDGRDEFAVGHRLAEFFDADVLVYGMDEEGLQQRYTVTGVGLGFDLLSDRIDGGRDVDGDGVGDLLVGDVFRNRATVHSGVDGSLLYEVNGLGQEGSFGTGHLVDDVNGDGRADLVLGAWGNGEGAEDAGRAFLYSGVDGALIRTMTPTVADYHFGIECRQMGDFNGDGALDFLIGATGGGFSGPPRGRIFVMAGIPADSTDVCPDGFTRLRGLPVSGDVGSLCEGDDDRLVTRPDVFAPTTTPPVQIEVEGTSPVDAPGSLSFTLESHVSVNNIQQRLLLFDFDEQAYVLVDTRIAPTSDESVEVAVEDPSVFIESGTGRVRALVQYVQVAFSILPTWQARIDRAVWTVGE